MNPSIHKLSGRYCPHCLLALWQMIETGFEFCPGNPDCDYEVQPGADQLEPLTQSEKVERVLNNKQHEHRILLQQIGDLQRRGAELARELTDIGLPPPAGSFSVAVMSKGKEAATALVEVDEGQRQMVLLALAVLALNRPGFDYALGVIASKFELPSGGLFEGFKEANRDQIPVIGVGLARQGGLGAPLTEFVVEVFNTACEWVPIPGCTFTTKEQALAEMQGRERNHGSRDMKVSEVGPFGRRTVATGLNGYTMRFHSVMRGE